MYKYQVGTGCGCSFDASLVFAWMTLRSSLRAPMGKRLRPTRPSSVTQSSKFAVVTFSFAKRAVHPCAQTVPSIYVVSRHPSPLDALIHLADANAQCVASVEKWTYIARTRRRARMTSKNFVILLARLPCDSMYVLRSRLALHRAIPDVATVLNAVPCNGIGEFVRRLLRLVNGVAESDRTEHASAVGDDIIAA